jgi:hypothetical protein
MFPPLPFVHAHVMNSGFCTIMSKPDDTYCTPILNYANPAVNFNGEPSGHCLSQNAVWIKENRFRIQDVGNEALVCRNTYTFDKKLIACLLLSKNKSSINCDEQFPEYTMWG